MSDSDYWFQVQVTVVCLVAVTLAILVGLFVFIWGPLGA